MLHPIEEKLLSWFIKNLSESLGKSIISQIELIKNVEREFTGSGAFISFELKSNNYIKINDDSFKGIIFDGIALFSDELEHESPVHINIDKDGKINYIEFEYGFLERNYPSEYEIKEININRIYCNNNLV